MKLFQKQYITVDIFIIVTVFVEQKFVSLANLNVEVVNVSPETSFAMDTSTTVSHSGELIAPTCPTKSSKRVAPQALLPTKGSALETLRLHLTQVAFLDSLDPARSPDNYFLPNMIFKHWH